ncbi:MAG: type II toxin-antitoxin system RelE family toxin, partial [Acidimicrobiales bacterium]
MPPDVAGAAVELITGPLLENPRRIVKLLRGELSSIYSARLGREWRILYEIDQDKHVVIVLDIQHRSA